MYVYEREGGRETDLLCVYRLKTWQLASWRPRRIDNVVQVQEQRSEDLESQQYKLCLRTGSLETQEKLMFQSKGRKRTMSQFKAVGEEEFILTGWRGRSDILFYSSFQLIGWSPSVLRRAICFTQSANSNLISSKNTLIGTPRITFDQVSGHPLAQLASHVKSVTRKGKDTYHLESYGPTAIPIEDVP